MKLKNLKKLKTIVFYFTDYFEGSNRGKGIVL